MIVWLLEVATPTYRYVIKVCLGAFWNIQGCLYSLKRKANLPLRVAFWLCSCVGKWIKRESLRVFLYTPIFSFFIQSLWIYFVLTKTQCHSIVFVFSLFLIFYCLSKTTLKFDLSLIKEIKSLYFYPPNRLLLPQVFSQYL